jgi:pilus assembly protein Flp/PilA
MKQLMKQFIHDESGQDLIEYALVAAVIALGAIAAMTSLAGAIGNGLNSVGNNFNSNV